MFKIVLSSITEINMYSLKAESHKDVYGVRKRVSFVWNYFEKLNRGRVRCNLCLHEQNYAGTTGNILRHLRSRHNINATIESQNSKPNLIPMQTSPECINDSVDFPYTTRDQLNDGFRHKSFENQNGFFLHELYNRKKNSYNRLNNLDPYADSTIKFGEYIFARGYDDGKLEKNSNTKDECYTRKKRLISDIKYYRAKAAYYRMQTNLTFLQAKKLKFKINQMT